MIAVLIANIEDDFERNFISRIYSEFYDEMKYRAYEIVFNMNDAEEIVDETFVRLIRNAKTVMRIDNKKLPAYLIISVKNVAINFKKRKEYEKKNTVYKLDIDNEIINSEQCLNTPEEKFLKKENLATLARILPMLPERDIRLLEAKYVLNLSGCEISKQFDIPETSIRTYIMRARRKAYELFLKEEKSNA